MCPSCQNRDWRESETIAASPVSCWAYLTLHVDISAYRYLSVTWGYVCHKKNMHVHTHTLTHISTQLTVPHLAWVCVYLAAPLRAFAGLESEFQMNECACMCAPLMVFFGGVSVIISALTTGPWTDETGPWTVSWSSVTATSVWDYTV